MNQGKVKMFNDEKGYGFIAQDSGEDVFVHITTVEMDSEGRGSISKGDEVEYECVKGPKGLQATIVRKIRDLEF